MRNLKLVLTLIAAMSSGAVSATPMFVGSWSVDQGPNWTTVPTAYSGQEAAALLFGGNAADYVISTIDNIVADIDLQAWVSVWGVLGGTKVAQDAKVDTGGLYAMFGDTSAYVDDHAIGRDFVNYAFRTTDTAPVPEPASYALMVMGIAAYGVRSRAQRYARIC